MLSCVDSADHWCRSSSGREEEVRIADAHVVGPVEVELLKLQTNLGKEIEYKQCDQIRRLWATF